MKPELLTLDITAMAHGGNGIGRHEGRAVFVPFTVPGDQIRARITQDKGRFATAEMVELLRPAPSRTAPRCRHFARCGGCHWQHIDYAAQLDLKQQIVRDTLGRIGGLRDALVHRTLAAPDPWEYRAHVTLRPSPQGRPGFVAVDGRQVIALDECPIMQPALLEQLSHLTPLRERTRVQVGSVGEPIHFPLGSDDDTTSSTSSGRQAVEYDIKGRAFRCSPGCFFQVNPAQAARLVELVLARLTLSGGARVLDLYAGVGLFSAFLAEQGSLVTAVEAFAPAVEDARHNLRDLRQVELHVGVIEAVLPELTRGYAAAVVDPPRAGMDASALQALIAHAPSQIIYVSCDPATLARDARKLVEAGYVLVDAQPVDMFPQTYHIETVAHFRR